jgi:hypothetical protein
VPFPHFPLFKKPCYSLLPCCGCTLAFRLTFFLFFLSSLQDVEAKVDALMEADPSMNNFSWLNEALAQLFLARKCMAYRWGGVGPGAAWESLGRSGSPAVVLVVGDGVGASGGAVSMALPASAPCPLSPVSVAALLTLSLLPGVPPSPATPAACSYIFAYYMFGQEMFADDFSPAANAINQALFEDKQVGSDCTAVDHPPPLLLLLLDLLICFLRICCCCCLP